MRRLCLVAILTLVGTVSAHADLTSATPAEGARLTTAPTEVTLSFSGPVETSFSIFKVYPLNAEVDMSAEDAPLQLNGLAGQLVSDVLTAQGDEAVRADTGVTLSGRSSEVTMPLAADLAPGLYVVMWRVISADTHPVERFYTFVCAPGN